MRLTIDDAQEPSDYNKAVIAFMTVRAQTPDQEVGNGGAIPHTIDGTSYLVVRNEDSYTVRVGGQVEDTMEALPI